MRIDLYTKTILTLITLLLAAIALKPLFQPQSVGAQGGVGYNYLAPQAGDATPEGGKNFIDLRNGNSWICDFKGCKLEGRFPLEKTR
jgi:hypothetical protein